MDKKIAALLGAAAAVATVGGAQAATQPNAASVALRALSYADLLAPVPNAVEHLKADEIARAKSPSRDGVELAKTVIVKHGRSRHHHHHHHHHHGATIGIPGVGGVTVGSGNHHHHHHHHHD